MNHTLYFSDDGLYQSFCKTGKTIYGSVSKAMNEAMRLWLREQQAWPHALANFTPDESDFRFEDARLDMHFKEKDLF